MPNHTVNRRILNPVTQKKYDRDAQIYFDAIGDLPVYVKNAINQRVLDFKANLGSLSDVAFWLPFPVTQTKFGGFREFISNSVMGNQVYDTSNNANPSPNYQLPKALAGNQGLVYWGTTPNIGAYRTGFVPSTELTLNDTCWAAIYQDTNLASAGFNHGAFNSSTQSMIFQKLDASNLQYADMYGNTITSGRARYTATGTGKIFIANRRSTTDFKLYKNGTQVASTSAAQGSLPSVEVLLNGYKTTTTNGQGSNDTLGSICYYNRSLTPAEVTAENTSWENFATAMKRTGTYEATILLDGDSHTVYHNAAWMRRIMWNMQSYEINHVDIGVSGQTMANMIANDATNLYPRIIAGNGTHYLIVGGNTNDISGGTSAATAYTNLQTYVNDAKTNASSKGVTLKVICIPLFNRLYTGDDAKIIAQSDYNNLVRAGWSGFADFFVEIPEPYSSKRSDYASDAAYITAVRAFANNTTYFMDGTHLVDGTLGYPAIADLITPVIIADL